MRRLLTAVIAVAVCTTVSLSAETLQQFDARVVKQLEAASPAAVPVWRSANAARDAGKHEDAVRLYADVFARVPSFVHALRRQAAEESQLGRRDLALPHIPRAVEIDRSAENLATLAEVRITYKDQRKPDATELTEARAVANEAAKLNARDS